MKVLISTEALKRHSLSIPAYMGYSQETINWRKKLGQLLGQWCTVETEYLFEDQFNIVENNLRVFARDIDGIKWEEDKGESYEWFKEKLKDGPGRKVNIRHIDLILERQKKLEETAS